MPGWAGWQPGTRADSMYVTAVTGGEFWGSGGQNMWQRLVGWYLLVKTCFTWSSYIVLLYVRARVEAQRRLRQTFNIP